MPAGEEYWRSGGRPPQGRNTRMIQRPYLEGKHLKVESAPGEEY